MEELIDKLHNKLIIKEDKKEDINYEEKKEEVNYKTLYIEKCNELNNIKKQLEDYKSKNQNIEPIINLTIENVIEPITKIKDKITDELVWSTIYKNKNNLDEYNKKIEYLMHEFGTSKQCNRFDIGNCIELIINDFLKSIGFDVEHLPNAKRIDLCLNKKYKISIKYSSGGEITLHNSNSSANRDETMHDLLLLTPDYLYLITNSELLKNNIDIKEYIHNAKDSLKLKAKLLTKLKEINYPYFIECKLNIDKKKCKNRSCYEVFYETVMKDYIKLNE